MRCSIRPRAPPSWCMCSRSDCNYLGSQKIEFRSQNENGDVSGSSQLLEEVSKLLEVYSQAILNSDY